MANPITMMADAAIALRAVVLNRGIVISLSERKESLNHLIFCHSVSLIRSTLVALVSVLWSIQSGMHYEFDEDYTIRWVLALVWVYMPSVFSILYAHDSYLNGI